MTLARKIFHCPANSKTFLPLAPHSPPCGGNSVYSWSYLDTRQPSLKVGPPPFLKMAPGDAHDGVSHMSLLSICLALACLLHWAAAGAVAVAGLLAALLVAQVPPVAVPAGCLIVAAAAV